MKKFLCLFLVTCFLFLFSAPSVYAASSFSVPLDGTLYYGDIANVKRMPSTGDGRYTIKLPSSWFQLNFSQPIEFKAGTYYTLNYGFEVAFLEAGYSDISNWSLSISVEGLGSTTASITSNGGSSGVWGHFSKPYTFYCDRNFTATYLEIELLSPSNVALPQFTISNKFTYQISSPAEIGADAIIQGSGMTPAPGIDTDNFNNAVGGMDQAEDAIGDAIGGFDNVDDELDSVMHPELDSDITSAFSQINSVFTQVVSVLDISSVMMFMLVFGLALFVIGRRLR